MQRALKEETQQLEYDLNEERSRYQNLLTEHLRLEEKYDDLKEEITFAVVSKQSFTDYKTSVLLPNWWVVLMTAQLVGLMKALYN